MAIRLVHTKRSVAAVFLFFFLLCLFSLPQTFFPGTAHGAVTPRPDYFISANVDPYFVTETITITYSASNLSDLSAPATTVKFSMAPAATPRKRKLIGSATMPALGPWQNVQGTVSFPLPGKLSAGLMWMQLWSHINPSRQQPERNVKNNLTVSGFGLQSTPPPPQAQADLSVSRLETAAQIQTGALLNITDTVENIGEKDAGAFTVSYTLKTATQQTLLGNRTVTTLAHGAASTGVMSVSVPTSLTPGAYTLVVQAIASAGGEETNFANNQAEKTILVNTPTPPLSPPSPPSGGTFLQGSEAHSVPATPRPPLYASQADPTFGATITRLTDPSMSPSDATHQTVGLRHEYARFPGLNADNSKMLVHILGGVYRGAFEVRDVSSGALLYRVPTAGDPEFSWHPTDPTRVFYRFGNEVRVFSTATGASTTVMSFPQYYSIGAREEGRPSDDWRYYAFIGYHDSSFATADLVVADLVERRIVVTLPNAGIPDWISMSPSGTYVVAQWVNGQGTRVYARDTLTSLRTAFSDFAHSDFAFDGDGNEVLVYHPTSAKQIIELGSPSGAPLAMARLADGQKTILLKISWRMTPHFSGIASRAHPGWVLVSTYTGPTTPQEPFSREVFWLKLDGSRAVRRIAHHHSDPSSRTDAQGGQVKDYFAEPQATSSWDGDIVLFSSIWNEPFNHYDLYAVTGQWW